MKDQVIKCNSPEHRDQIFKFWKEHDLHPNLIYQMKLYNKNTVYKENLYYGFINNEFGDYSKEIVKNSRPSIIELPLKYTLKGGDKVLALDRDGIKKPAIFITNLEKIDEYEILNPYIVIFEHDIKQNGYIARCCSDCEPIVKDKVTIEKVLASWDKGRVNLEGNISFDNVRLRDCDLSYSAHDKEYIITYFVETYRSYLYRLDRVKIL